MVVNYLPADLDDDVGLAAAGAPDDTVVGTEGEGVVEGGGGKGAAREDSV